MCRLGLGAAECFVLKACGRSWNKTGSFCSVVMKLPCGLSQVWLPFPGNEGILAIVPRNLPSSPVTEGLN